MKLFVNDNELVFAGRTLADLLEQLGKPQQGLAIAINQQVVPKSLWEKTFLEDAMKVFIFESIAGG